MKSKASNNNGKQLRLKDLAEHPAELSMAVGMVHESKSLTQIRDFLGKNGFTFSIATISSFKKKVLTADATGQNVDDLIKGKKQLKDVKGKMSGFTGNQPSVEGFPEDNLKNQQLRYKELNKENIDVVPLEDNSNNQFVSVRATMEDMINVGINTFKQLNTLDQQSLLKLLVEYNKAFGAKDNGLTLSSLKQYQLIVMSQQRAMAKILLKYVPEDKRGDASAEMEKRTSEIIETVAQTKDGKTLISELKKAGLEI